MINHTPGPWHKELGAYVYSSGVKVANVHFALNESERTANARLIAAAPDLLAVLQELIDIEGPQPGSAEWAKKALAVIAKATGVTNE